MKKWIYELQFNAGEDVKILLAGNKVDLANQRQVSKEEGKALADSYNLMFMETTATDDKSVTDAFEELLKSM